MKPRLINVLKTCILIISIVIAYVAILHIRRTILFRRSVEYPVEVASVTPPPSSVYALSSEAVNDPTGICVYLYYWYFENRGETRNDWLAFLLINHRPVLSVTPVIVEVSFDTYCWDVRFTPGKKYLVDYILVNPSDLTILTYSWAFRVSD